ncbi:MAG TPA: type VI secretion system baseplate subunit TssK, partial [Zoogloea sp.]|nr:type VI secretion system baseplate subunit TssK [Zoogloea sp.]
MSWFSRVVWSEGLFLQPQHFQQQDRHATWWVESRVAPLVGNHWGFSHLVIDEAALVAGKFAILEARGILPDGTPFDIPNADLPPPALDFPRDAKDQVVCLALPLRRAQGLEVSLDSADATARLARYEPVDFEVSDAHTEKGGAFSIQVGQPKLRLALSDPLTDAYARVGVARVTERRADN